MQKKWKISGFCLLITNKIVIFAQMKINDINKEHLLIVVVWIFIYAFAPLYIWYADTLNGFEFNVGRMYGMWVMTAAFLLLFLVHHFVLAPMLFMRKRYAVYAAALLLCMAVFTIGVVSHDPKSFGRKDGMHLHPDFMPPRNGMSDAMPPWAHAPRKMLAPPDVACLLIALMMIGLDLSIVTWSNGQKLRRRLLLLEKQNLKQELEHLRYQINPHFFMNTLNNIHVLVDVDKERAKRAIIELSGLMRHSLYNGGEGMTPLQNEIDFLRQYISLMQLRFGNRVKLECHMPDAPSPDILIPSLLFATFIENAFKHGISHKTPSHIILDLDVDEKMNVIHFRCENSRDETSVATHDGYHGIGLSNVRKRLDLQYGDGYTMTIDDGNPDKYVVELNLQIHHIIPSV